jgi:hypothetical protein
LLTPGWSAIESNGELAKSGTNTAINIARFSVTAADSLHMAVSSDAVQNSSEE